MSLEFKTDVDPIIKRIESETGTIICSGTLKIAIFNMVEEGKSYDEIFSYYIKMNELFKTKEFKERFTKDLIHLTQKLYRIA